MWYTVFIFARSKENAMKHLLKQLKAYRKESILGPLFKLLEAGFELLVPLLVAAMIDQGVKLGDKSVIVRMSLMMVGLGLIGLLCSVTAQYFAAKAAVGSTTRLRRALFAHLQTLSYTELDTIGASTMLTRLTSDMNQVQSGVNLTLRLALRSPFVVFGAMVMAFTIDVHAAAVFAIVIPILFAVVFGVMIVCIPLYRKVQARLDRVLGMTRENLTGVRVLRAFGREEEQKREFSARNEALTKEQNHVGRISVLLNPVTYVIINLAIVALMGMFRQRHSACSPLPLSVPMALISTPALSHGTTQARTSCTRARYLARSAESTK
jgi:ATP-binding cassette subfamily B multidrug efflux pump